MMSLVSTVVSFLMGGLPKLLDFFQDRQDKKHEITLARMQNDKEFHICLLYTSPSPRDS